MNSSDEGDDNIVCFTEEYKAMRLNRYECDLRCWEGLVWLGAPHGPQPTLPNFLREEKQ